MRTFENHSLLTATNNFYSHKTWYARLAKFCVALFVLYLVDLSELNGGPGLLVTCGLILAVCMALTPVCDLALDQDKIYFIKTSIIPGFGSVKSFDVSRIRRVGYYANNPAPSVFSLFVPTTNLYRIEFTFHDDHSQSEDWFVSKKDLKRIVSELRLLMNAESPR